MLIRGQCCRFLNGSLLHYQGSCKGGVRHKLTEFNFLQNGLIVSNFQHKIFFMGAGLQILASYSCVLAHTCDYTICSFAIFGNFEGIKNCHLWQFLGSIITVENAKYCQKQQKCDLICLQSCRSFHFWQYYATIYCHF